MAQGYDYEFDPVLDSKYECPICLLCLRNPVQTWCGHRFCKECITSWIKNEKPVCPKDNLPINDDQIFEDNFVRREILHLTAKCPYYLNGCSSIFPIFQMEEHEIKCTYRVMLCPKACGIQVTQRLLQSHLVNDCPNRIVTCSLCLNQYPCIKEEEHILKCKRSPFNCPHCLQPMTQDLLDIHLSTECPKALIRCPYFSLGCTDMVERSQISLHIDGSIQNHMQLIASKVLNDNCEGLPGSYMTSPRSESSSSLRSHPSASNIKASSPVLKKQLYLQKSKSVDKEYHEADESSELRWIKDICAKNITLDQKSREQDIEIRNLRQQLEDMKKSVNENMNHLFNRLCNGIYLWHIGDISKILDECPVLNSDGFYTSVYGYKLCLRISFSRNYLCLFLHMMQGEFDQHLAWPFTGRIKLMLLDQNENSDSRKHVEEVTEAMPEYLAFQRPAARINQKGFGYTDFISLESLSNGTFVKDDAIIIKAVVEEGYSL